MRKHVFLLSLILLLLGTGRCMAQFENFEGDNSNGRSNGGGNGNTSGRQTFMDRLRFSGNFGMGFSHGCFAANFDPAVGYAFNPFITAGLIGTCEYYSYDDSYYNDQYSQSTFGIGAYLEAYPIDFLVLHGEYQKITFKDYYNNTFDPDRIFDHILLIGGGYRIVISERSSANIMFLWNLNANEAIRHNTSFSNPVLRFNIVF